MINIIHICRNTTGGIGTVIKLFSNYLSKSKFRVSTLCLTQDILNDKFNISKAYSEYEILKEEFRKYKGSNNIAHFHGGWTFHVLLLNNIRIPSIISPHGALHKISLKKSKLLKYIAKTLYMKKAYSNATCILAATEDEVQDIHDFGLKNKCIALIPNSINLNEKLIVDDLLKKKLLTSAGEKKILLSLSRLHVSKGLDILIDAFYNLSLVDNSFVLFIVGDGDKKYTEKLNRKIKEFNMEKKIFMLGSMIGKNKNTVYDVADLYILPSYNEGFGLTVLEALRQNTPVITTTATSFKEIDRVGCGWYINPTVNDIYLTLVNATRLTKQELLLKGQLGHTWVEDNYSVSIINRKIETLYSWLVHGGDTPEFIMDNTINE